MRSIGEGGVPLGLGSIHPDIARGTSFATKRGGRPDIPEGLSFYCASRRAATFRVREEGNI